MAGWLTFSVLAISEMDCSLTVASSHLLRSFRWKLDARAFMDSCRDANVPAALERSRSGNVAHRISQSLSICNHNHSTSKDQQPADRSHGGRLCAPHKVAENDYKERIGDFKDRRGERTEQPNTRKNEEIGEPVRS